jgi:hypothetical protein
VTATEQTINKSSIYIGKEWVVIWIDL